MDQERNSYLIPASIIVAGLLIAFAVVYTSGTKSAPNILNGAGSGSNSDNSPSGAPKAIKPVPSDYALGSPDAKVAVIEYGDFQCPFCGRFFKTVEAPLRENYIKSGKVLFIWRDFAFLGEESFRSAEAARCAGEQGKFWEYHDYLFNNQKGENEGAFSDANLKSFASILGLNASALASCLDSGKYRKDVLSSTEEGKNFGVSGTPTTFINGREVSGAVPFAALESIIEEELKK